MLSKRKIGLVMSLALIIMLSYSTNSEAFDGYQINNSSIEPMWSYAANVEAYIFASGRSLDSEINIIAKNPSYKISGTMYLERYSNGRWISVSSWSFSGTGSINLYKSYSGLSGNNYRTRVSAIINGERASGTSRSVSL